MRIFVVALAYCCVADGTSPESSNDSRNAVTLEETIDLITGDGEGHHLERSGRKLFKKLHSGAAFVAGVKLGSYLAGKGLDLGTGSLATSHSFQLFGKSVSTALSLSYGGNPLTVPFHDPIDNSSTPERLLENNVIHIAIIEPSPEVLNQLKNLARISENRSSNTTKVPPEPMKHDTKEKQFKQFLQQHTQRIDEFNRKMLNKTRTNSRF